MQSGQNSHATDSNHSTTPESGDEHDDTDMRNEEQARKEILDAALAFVPQHGWTRDALAEGAKSIGYCDVTHGMFQRGGVELVHHFNVSCNRKLVEQLKSQSRERKQRIIRNVRSSLTIRLKMIAPYIDTWPKAMALLSIPSNVPESIRNVAVLMDDIWYYAGDRTPHFDWYTKRFALASIYFATELTMIQDKSEDFVDTWQFLERRLEQLDQMQKFVGGFPDFVQGFFTLIKNAMGHGRT